MASEGMIFLAFYLVACVVSIGVMMQFPEYARPASLAAFCSLGLFFITAFALLFQS